MSGYNGFVPDLTCIQIKILKEHVNIFQYSLRIFHLRVFFCIFNKIVFYSGIEADIAFDRSSVFLPSRINRLLLMLFKALEMSAFK